MAINLSNIIFTDQDDIVPPSGAEPIFVPSFTTINTLAGDDIINGGNDLTDNYGFSNILGTLNTNSGNDLITGISQGSYRGSFGSGITNKGTFEPSEAGFATINTGDGNDTITGISKGYGIANIIGFIDTGEGNDIITGIGNGYGILTEVTTINTGNGDDIITAIGGDTGIDSRVNTTINTGDGNDIITATGDSGRGILLLGGTIDTGEGNDIINGTGDTDGLVFSTPVFSYVESRIDTGEGDDIITGTGSYAGISNDGTINTGNGKDSVISHGAFRNGRMFLGDGDDSITADIDFSGRAIENFQMIDTGYGNDIITSTGVIYNGGTIITGEGNDSIIANEGFESAPNSSGTWFLGEGEDYLKGYGSGDFYGGSGNDTLELTPGTYTVGIWGEGGESPIFTKGNQLMITSEFEKLKAGNTLYDFTSLTAGQIIIVA
jgi:hypothetical protein